MKIRQIGAFEAKTRFSELLELVNRGQSFQITRRGKPVAVLGPSLGLGVRSKPRSSLLGLSRQIRSQSRPGKEAFKELARFGHKY